MPRTRHDCLGAMERSDERASRTDQDDLSPRERDRHRHSVTWAGSSAVTHISRHLYLFPTLECVVVVDVPPVVDWLFERDVVLWRPLFRPGRWRQARAAGPWIAGTVMITMAGLLGPCHQRAHLSNLRVDMITWRSLIQVSITPCCPRSRLPAAVGPLSR